MENQRLLRFWAAERYGSLGLTDFRYDQVMMEEVGRSLESCLWTGALDRNSPPYIANYGSEATKGHYLPKLASGEMICGIAMTEPDAGSDIAGSKTRAEQRADGSCVLRMQSENKHLSEEQARHLTIHGVNRNEDGSFSWKFDNYLRSSPPLDITDAELHALWAGSRARPCSLMARTAGRRTPRRMAVRHISPRRGSSTTTMPGTGCIMTGSTDSWPT